MSHVFGRNARTDLPVAVSGEGCYLIDRDGKRYLDGSGGAAVSCLGHSNDEVKEAIKQQLDALAFAHTGFFTSEPAEALADKLIKHAPEGLDRVYFVSGGSEAVEAAIKLARQYHVERGEDERDILIARRQSYHGNTLGALAASGNLWRRQMFNPILVETRHIAPCYAWRDQRLDETAFAYGQRVANELEAEILALGPDKVMGFIAEPVVGATLGAVPAVKGYFERIREICDQYGVLLILDEVMCGMGRTGHIYACAEDSVSPDILTIAKGLGAGYQPIGAMLASRKIYDTIAKGSGFFQHGHTYLGHPVTTAGASKVFDIISSESMMEQVRAKGAQLIAALTDRFGQHPHIGDIRGRGLFLGLEFVADRETKKPFDPQKAIHKHFKAAAFEAGLICYPMGGTIDGQHGDHVLLAPPFIINDSQINECVDKIDIALKKVMQ
ncbi:MAG: aspartate aminotransferase family protein [Candidatus Puniceispirillum sp. TMED52]|nr:aspartate aminotransferase family protein [SAR116 cluster bacterium]OUU50837.1 MAG: aspartate aminotransferase family protein [Candidatus Puniceispirillum sp. TMED52]